mmetsp:Transcript_38244/g.109427  ORF Transcript_38244/g.109427 Transcript_38244/m.109427 type:complete len:289 (+) Transcript_38244:113-979(+)
MCLEFSVGSETHLTNSSVLEGSSRLTWRSPLVPARCKGADSWPEPGPLGSFADRRQRLVDTSGRSTSTSTISSARVTASSALRLFCSTQKRLRPPMSPRLSNRCSKVLAFEPTCSMPRSDVLEGPLTRSAQGWLPPAMSPSARSQPRGKKWSWMRSRPAAWKTGLSTDSPARQTSSSLEQLSRRHSTRRIDLLFTPSTSWVTLWRKFASHDHARVYARSVTSGPLPGIVSSSSPMYLVVSSGPCLSVSDSFVSCVPGIGSTLWTSKVKSRTSRPMQKVSARRSHRRPG